jgi:hypothetical protein
MKRSPISEMFFVSLESLSSFGSLLFLLNPAA